MKMHNRHYFFFCSMIVVLFSVFTPAVNSVNAAPVIHPLPSGIDSGASSAYTTAAGVQFSADYARSGGIVRRSSGEINNTQDDTLYRTRVVAPIGQSVTYHLEAPQGVTQLDISGHFNEHFHEGPGARLIDVEVRCPGSAEPWNSGVMVEEDLDIFAEAGGRNSALVRHWGRVDISGGEVEITLTASAASPDDALISAIEFAGPPPAIASPPSGIDSGASSAYTTAAGIQFSADYARSGGIVRSSSGEVHNTDDDTLYLSRVVAPIGQSVTYRLAAPQGATELDISGHFNEHFHEGPGARLIDVEVRCPGSAEPWNSGVMVEEDLDIFAEAGGRNSALVRDWGRVDISGGEVEITLTASAASPDDALISAIEFAGPPPAIASPPSGIDSGASSAYTTAAGIQFSADYARSGGIVRSSSGEVHNTDDDTLYLTRVVAPLGQSVTYHLAAPQGVTELNISGHFNEHFRDSPGARLIDVEVRCPGSPEPWNSGVMVEEELDIFIEAGGRNNALVRDWGRVDISGGEVEITLTASDTSPDAALISAIEFAN